MHPTGAPEVPSLKSFHKSPETDGGMATGLRSCSCCKKRGPSPLNPRTEDPCLKSPLEVSSHAGLPTSAEGRNTDFFSCREIAATTPRAPLASRRTPHTRLPARRPHPCSCRSRVLCTCSHRCHSHAQPANQRLKTAVALYHSTKHRKASQTLLPKPYSNLQSVSNSTCLSFVSSPRRRMLNSWPKVSGCHSQVVNPSLSKAGVQRAHFSISRLAFVKEKPQTNLILKGKAISQCQAIWFSVEKKLGTQMS